MSLWVIYSLAAAILIVAGVFATVRGLRRPRRFTFASALGTGTPTTPEEAGVTGRAVTFALADGSQTPGFIVEGRRADGPCLVAQHGFGSSRYRCFVWLQPFLPHVSSLVFFDQRGHGESSSKHCHGGVTEVDDLLGVLDQLPGELLQHGLVLYGRSMGAGSALGAGARLSQSPRKDAALRAVIAEGPYAKWDQPLYRIFRRNRWPSWPVIPLAGLAMRVVQPSLLRFDRLRDAAQLACPLLVLHGDNDDTCPLALGQAIAGAAPDGTLVVFPEGQHFGLAEHDPLRYGEALADFFGKLRE